MKHLSLLAMVAILFVSTNAAAQTDLTIGGSQIAGGDLTFLVTGNAPLSPVFLLGSDMAGSTDIGGVITLGIVNPLVPFHTMYSDMMGDASASLTLPDPLPMWLTGYDIYVQALSLDWMGTTATPNGWSLPFGIALSDVESFQL